MGNISLQQRPVSLQARLGPYNGAETALDFGDPAAELAVLREQCGVFDLGWRAKIKIAGKDRVRWLHNMVTNNVRDLALNRGNYNFVLNAQGRILGDIYIYNRGESFLVDTDRTQVEPLLTAMKRFIIMDKVEMSATDEILSLGLCGPKAGEVLAVVGIDAQRLSPLEIGEYALGDRQVTVVRGPENKPNWYEIWTDNRGVEITAKKLQSTGARMVGTQALEWWRILQGIPHYGQDIRDRDLPQETGQAQALNFNKGCYIGQEIVERIRSRGHLHRTFTGFEFAGPPPAMGKHESAGRAIAEITSFAQIPTSVGERNLGLGYVRLDVIGDEPTVELNGSTARIAELPFAIE